MTRFVDSNVFVYHLAADMAYGKRATAILKSIEDGEEAATSTLAAIQVCSYLKWKKAHEAIPSFLALLKSLTTLKKYETTILDFEEAKRIQSDLKLSWLYWDNALIAAQMKRLGITEIYSNDGDFDKFPQIKRIF